MCELKVWRTIVIRYTYGVGRRVLLLGGETSSSLGSVQGSLSSNNGLSLSIAGATSAASDLGGGIPVIHFEGCEVVSEVCICNRRWFLSQSSENAKCCLLSE